MIIANNQAALAILTSVVEQLQAIGVNCLLSPTHGSLWRIGMPDVAETVQAALASDVETHRGAVPTLPKT